MNERGFADKPTEDTDSVSDVNSSLVGGVKETTNERPVEGGLFVVTILHTVHRLRPG
jgi:hypothetical protein